MRPTVRGLQQEYEDQVRFVSYSLEYKGGLQQAAKFQIRHAPAVVLLTADGAVSERLMGVVSEERLRRALEDLSTGPPHQ